MPADRATPRIQLKSKVHIVVLVILVLVLGLASIAWVGMDTLSGIRGFVWAEGQWSKHQKDASHHLLRHLYTKDAEEYAEFSADIERIRAARRSRLELDKRDPDPRVVEAGFVGINVARTDVPAMSRVYRRFHSFEQIKRAVEVWILADAQIERLARQGETVRKLMAAGPPSRAQRDQAVAAITALNQRLGRLEHRFSASLGEAAHWAGGVLTTALFGAALLVCGIVLWLGLFGGRIITRSERYAQDLEQKNWLKNGQTELNEQIRGERPEQELCHNAICFLARRLEAQVGAFYLADEQGQLKLLASYAYQRRKELSNSYAPGEGLVGQAALERQVIRVSEVPQDYVRVSSGLGSVTPREILVFPLQLERRVVGVLELGSVTPFEEQHLELLEAAAESIALALHGARARRQVQELLEQTQQQAEALQVQQEELRQSNEELEQQADALQSSEGRLREQQAELEATNAELEERGEALERERSQVALQNRELEAASKALVEVARRLCDGVRASDSVVRWGGEEFLLLLRDTDPRQVDVVARRVCQLVRQRPFVTLVGPVEVTCSVGYTLFPVDCEARFLWEDTVSIADQALFVAKQRGRDRCVGVRSVQRSLDHAARRRILDDLEAAARAGLVVLDEAR